MNEGPTGRKFILPVAALSLVALLAFFALRPPRLAWGTSYRDPACPRGFKAMVVCMGARRSS